MNMEMMTNLIGLLFPVLGLMGALFRYTYAPKKGWLYVSIYFLSRILSDYYWTVYTFVMGETPEGNEFITNLGWNLAYIILVFIVIKAGHKEAKGYFNPLMLLPVPITLVQFFIYIQYGAILLNIWQVGLSTVSMVVCCRALLYYYKNKKKGALFPYLHAVVLFMLAMDYVMWTASCYDWPSDYVNPYFYAQLIGGIAAVFMARAVGKDYEQEGFSYPVHSSRDIRFQLTLQVIALLVILGCFSGGIYISLYAKKILLAQGADDQAYEIISLILFLISVFQVIAMIAVLFVISMRSRNAEQSSVETEGKGHKRIGIALTFLVTLGLMVFSVIYTSRLFYKVSVADIYGAGDKSAEVVSAALWNYLSDASSALQVTANSVDFMLTSGESQETIDDYLVYQTKLHQDMFSEDFTGVYSYIRNEYIDGSGWVPPADYDPTKRDWYRKALEAGGETIIVSPYVDAQTGDVVITICKQISDGKGSFENSKNVVAVDVIINYIQEVVENATVNGKGYCMVVNRDGMIVAHKDRSLVGDSFTDIFGEDLLDEILAVDSMEVKDIAYNDEYALFVKPVHERWYVVMAVDNSELFEETNSQLAVNVLVSLIIFAFIALFYFIGYKNEQVFGRKMQEMRIDRQKQEYDAEVLRLEKVSAEKASKAKSSFLADMSHEIRTPINAILGMNEMILRESDQKEILEYSHNIGVSGRNLLQLINSILDFSKIEDGKMEIVPVRYSVRSLVTYLANSVTERARNKGLELRLDIDETLPSELFGDDTRINQVIVNLLTNAVKYTEKGFVTLTLKEKERKEGNSLIYVEVRDTGIGIREEDMEKLFESFERLDVVKNRNIEGTGLGMSIVTKLLKLMGSELKVTSTYGVGSVFSFELLQRIEDDTPIGKYDISSAGEDETRIEEFTLYAPGARVLIVDDTRMNIMVAVNLLKTTGIKIDTASGGQEAVDLADKNRYDVILMDQRMPGMDGTQALKAIRALESGINKDTPVICLTADAIRGARAHYMAEGFSDYLTKPVNGSSLEKMLTKYLPKELIKNKNGESLANAENEGKADKKPDIGALKKAGLNTVEAMSFCRDDLDIYKEILTEFVNVSGEKIKDMERYYAAKDWENYVIHAHSLKSSARIVGDEGLSELAAGLEAAAKDGDADAIEKDHEKMIIMYKQITGTISGILGITGLSYNEDGDILEFSPKKN